MRGAGAATDERQRINLIVIPGLTGDLLIYKAALVLFRPQADRQKTTIYNSGPPRNSSLSTKVKRFAFKACLRCMGGDLSAVVASTSRRPRTSMCLVKAGSRPVQIATPAFQPTPGLPRFHPRSSGILSTILGKSLDT